MLTVFTPPVTEPVSLAEAKAQLRITTSDEDGLIAGYLIAARQHCENIMGRALVTRTYEQTLDYQWPESDGSTYIMPAMPPLVSVTQISYVDNSGNTIVLPSNQYRVLPRDPYGVVVPAFGVVWPPIRSQLDAATIRFVAGYGAIGAIPEPIRLAILLLTAHYYENREAVIVSRDLPSTLPMAVDSLLSLYRTFF